MKAFTFIGILSILFLVSCGSDNNSGAGTLRTTTDNINTNGGYNGNTSGKTCGNIFSQFDGFNIYFLFITNQGQYNLIAGDQSTQSLLNQMPPNVYAYNVCGTPVGQQNQGTITLINLTQH